jgi:6-phosphogluconolactonase
MPLDVWVVGMGVDMHTASLFPGADQLARALARDAPVLLAMRAPGAPEPRMTLSATALRSANDLHLLFFGSDKRAAFAHACQDGPVGAAPVRAVLDRATVFYAD